jgi:very-short-patch-repair endonuclease
MEAKIKCPHCGKEYSKYGIGNHIWRNHGEGKNFDPNKGYKDGTRQVWNKGLTKETDDRTKHHSELLLKKYKNGELTPVNRGKIMSDEQKEKISESRIKFLIENPDKVPYLLNHSSEMSYPEKILANALSESGICGWVYNYRNGLYAYDFGFPDIKLDIEVDGATHNLEKVKKIDIKRDKFSKSLGWTVLRFSASEIKENVIRCITIIKEEILKLNN